VASEGASFHTGVAAGARSVEHPGQMGAAELLGPAGPFARAMAGYESRPSQLEMAAAVERCL